MRTVHYAIGQVGNAASESYRVDIYRLRREGPFVRLDFGIVCEKVTGQYAGQGCETHFAFSAGSASGRLSTVDGVKLVDPAGKLEYLVVRDDKGYPFCSEIAPGIPADATVFVAFANFPAPPEGTTSMTVVLPNGGPQLSNIAVS